jgi:predicted translin family RNA/ssDNA-binding protein
MSQQKQREQTISKITSILLDDNLKNNSKTVTKLKETIATFNDIDFQKLLENQLNMLLDKKSSTPSLDRIKLEKLKGLKYQDVPAIDLKDVTKNTQKRVESLAIKNLLKNRGGEPQKISVKTVLGKVYQKAQQLGMGK